MLAARHAIVKLGRCASASKQLVAQARRPSLLPARRAGAAVSAWCGGGSAARPSGDSHPLPTPDLLLEGKLFGERADRVRRRRMSASSPLVLRKRSANANKYDSMCPFASDMRPCGTDARRCDEFVVDLPGSHLDLEWVSTSERLLPHPPSVPPSPARGRRSAAGLAFSRCVPFKSKLAHMAARTSPCLRGACAFAQRGS